MGLFSFLFFSIKVGLADIPTGVVGQWGGACYVVTIEGIMRMWEWVYLC